MQNIKLIAISDLHQGNRVEPPSKVKVNSPENLILNLIERKPDGFLVAGDLQDYMWSLGINAEIKSEIKKNISEDKVFNILNNSSIPIYYIWGNTDVMEFEKSSDYAPVTDEIRDWFSEEFTNFHYCHKQNLNLKGLPIIGYNDANKTTEEHSGKCWEESEILHDFLPLIRSLDQKERQRCIFLTHTPPRGILDFSSLGEKNIGSFYLREFIEDYQPLISIFGHVHYCGGYSQYVGRTQAINSSSFGLAISHSILFGQSSFELTIDVKEANILSTKMIVPHYWHAKKRKPFVEYRPCSNCGRYSPFARKKFKTCRICLGSKRIQNKVIIV